MDQGGTAKDCAASVRECIRANGKNGKPADAGAQGGGQNDPTHGKPDAGH
jgi:hypothetical protein